MGTTDILNNIGGNSYSGIGFSILALLKLPVIIVLFGNVLFAILLFLRARILADTFKAPQNILIKIIIPIYLAITLIGSIIAILFLLIG